MAGTFDFLSDFYPCKDSAPGLFLRFPVPLTEHHTMKAYWGSAGVVARILDLGIR
jgi:hypothetical protein